MTGGASQDELLLDIREHVRLHVPVPFTCVFSEARASRLFTKKRTGIGLVCDASIKDACVSIEAFIYSAYMRHSDRMHEPWQGL